jgi:hypothetical protein
MAGWIGEPYHSIFPETAAGKESTVTRVSTCVLAWGLVILSSPAYAHRPTMSDGTAVDADHAIEFQDVQISRVVYHEATKQAPQVWITFEVDKPQELFLQIGVPVLDRLRQYRPALALLGPGLPDVRLPFEFPSGLGGLVLDTRSVEKPRDFYEPFTGTSSWILKEQDVQLPDAGRYYVVAYDPDGKPGKLWAALGRKEAWGGQGHAENAEDHHRRASVSRSCSDEPARFKAPRTACDLRFRYP